MKRIEINEGEKITNKFYQLSHSSPLFEYLNKEEYNLYDYDKGVININKMGFDQNRIFYDIRNHTHVDTDVVSYCIEPNGAICFSIDDLVNDKTKCIRIHEFEHRDIVEYIFQIGLSSDKLNLPYVDSYSFMSRMKNISSISEVFQHFYTDIYLDSKSEEHFEVHARTLGAYKAGIIHIKHMIDSLPEFTWFKREDIAKKNVNHKLLEYDDDDENRLYLSMFKITNNKLIAGYNFCLDYYQVNDEVQSYKNYVHGELFQKLKPMYRSQSVSCILKDL